MPRRRASETPEERDRRRELQRGYEKASYHRKKQAIASLKTELENLQREFQELSARRVEVVEADNGDSVSETHTDSESDDHVIEWDATKRRRNAAVRRLYRTKQAVDELRKENAELQTDIDERALLEAQIRDVVDEHLAILPVEQPCACISLPRAVSSELIAKAQDHALRFFYDDAKLSTGSSIFGWRDYRKPLANDMLDFAMEREFSPYSVDNLAPITWDILSSADGFASLYDRALKPQVYLLEKVNEDTIFFYSILEPMPGDIAKSLYLVSRAAIDGGFLIVLCAVDPNLVCFCDNDSSLESKHATIVWQNICAWVVVLEKGPGRTLFHHGGTNHIMYMLEALLIVLRWHTKVIGPLLVLPLSSSCSDSESVVTT